MPPTSAPRFVDANVFLRYFTGSDPAKAERARQLLERVERGEEKVTTDTLVVFETVFTLERSYKVPKPQVREMIADIFSLPGIQLRGKRLCFDALDLYVAKNVSYVDAYIATSMKARGLTEIYSWDSDFDKLPGIRRVEPGEDASA
jgi:predicted nucleic acid-binding protein